MTTQAGAHWKINSGEHLIFMLMGNHGAGLVALIGCLFSPLEMQGYLEFL